MLEVTYPPARMNREEYREWRRWWLGQAKANRADGDDELLQNSQEALAWLRHEKKLNEGWWEFIEIF